VEFKVSITNNKVLSDQETIYVLKSALMKAIRSSNWRYAVKIGYVFFKIDRESFFAMVRQSCGEDLNPQGLKFVPIISEISKKCFWHDVPNLIYTMSRYCKWYEPYKDISESKDELLELNDLKHSMDAKEITIPLFSWIFDEHCQIKGLKLKDFSLSGCWYNRHKIAETGGAAVNKQVGTLKYTAESNQITAEVKELVQSNSNEQESLKKDSLNLT